MPLAELWAWFLVAPFVFEAESLQPSPKPSNQPWGNLHNPQTYLHTKGQTWEKSSSAGGWETHSTLAAEQQREREERGGSGWGAGTPCRWESSHGSGITGRITQVSCQILFTREAMAPYGQRERSFWGRLRNNSTPPSCSFSPSQVSADHMQVAWERAQERLGTPRPAHRELLQLLPPTPRPREKGLKGQAASQGDLSPAPLCPGDLRGAAPGKQEQSLAWGLPSFSPLLSVQTCSSCASSGITRKVLQPWRFLDLRMSPKIWSPMYKISFPLAPSRSQTVSEEPERRMAWLRTGSQKETSGSFQRARARDRAGAFSSQKPPLLNRAPLLGRGTGHCPPTWEFTQGQLCPRTHPHEWQQQSGHAASHPM